MGGLDPSMQDGLGNDLTRVSSSGNSIKILQYLNKNELTKTGFNYHNGI